MAISRGSLTYHLRPLAVLAGLLVFGVFCWGLQVEGRVAIVPSFYLSLLGVWSVVLAGLIIWPTWVRRGNEDLVIFCRALWCNAGAILLAMAIPYSIRFLLLVIPVFGLFYAALHLTRSRVLGVAFCSWAVYVLGLVFLAQHYTESSGDARFETLSFIAFSLMLVSALLLSHEVMTVRNRLARQNRTLQELMRQTQDVAMRDELTGAHNRRHVLEILDRQKALADRNQQSFTVCFCDLDHFKQVNDQYGHAAGDQALTDFARLAQATVRSVDYVARLGGEEFLLVLVGVDEFVARSIATRLVEGTRKLMPQGVKTPAVLSVSIGVTSYRARESIDELLRRADDALYKAKAQGRDQVVVMERDAA